MLKACDEKLKLSTTLASCLSDDRQQSKVSHSLEELFQQRLFAIACGYADGNDAARLADDPVMKLMAGRDPVVGRSLASQPTLSRFENAARQRDLLRLSEALADAVIARNKRPRSECDTLPLNWTRQMIRPMAPSSWRFSTASTTPRAICRWRVFSPSTTPRAICRWRVFSPSTTRWRSTCFAYVLRAGNVAAKHGVIRVLRRLGRRAPRIRRNGTTTPEIPPDRQDNENLRTVQARLQ